MIKWDLKLKHNIFTLALKKMKYLGINLTKYIKDLYKETYKILINEVKEELNKWRDIPSSRMGGLSKVQISDVSNLIYRFHGIPIKIQASNFMDINTLLLKFIRRDIRPRLANTILK